MDETTGDVLGGREYAILHGDCAEVLRSLPADSFDMCVTSPPYFGLRDYHAGDMEIGKEPSHEEYVKRLVDVFHEVRRVLKGTGTLWLNLGDTYAPDNNLRGIPWRVAFALQEDGWTLRSDIIWHKPNAMPQSVKNRCSSAHEYIFMFSKVPSGYYFDYESIEEPANYDGRKATMLQGGPKYEGQLILPDGKTQDMASRPHERWRWKRVDSSSENENDDHDAPARTSIRFGGTKYPGKESGADSTYSGRAWEPRYKNLMAEEKGQQSHSFHLRRAMGLQDEVYAVRRKRDVWTVPTKGFAGAHFATFPEKLIRPCILAGCPRHGIVLDVFNGSGTTGVVAMNNNRRYVGIDLNEEYIAIAHDRISREAAQMMLDL